VDNADCQLERSDESIRHHFREPTAERQFQQQLVYTKFLTRSQSPEYQKKITVQLNKGEALHALRRDVFIANEGKIRKRHHEDQLNQAACLNLVVNAITVWNTVYMQAALEQLKSEGYEINEDDVKQLSPARSEHVNMYGKYYFNIEEGLKRKGLRELRKPQNDFPLW
jgi:hypothetical protein